ncbi:MAG: hypothetical protein ABH832_03440 [bacterium]
MEVHMQEQTDAELLKRDQFLSGCGFSSLKALEKSRPLPAAPERTREFVDDGGSEQALGAARIKLEPVIRR